MFVSRALLLQYENFSRNTLGPALRKIGQSMYKASARIQGEFFQEDRCNNT